MKKLLDLSEDEMVQCVTAPRQHQCTSCGKTGPWTKEWSWYGSYKQADVYGWDAIPKLCSEACKAKWASKNAKLVAADEASQSGRRSR